MKRFTTLLTVMILLSAVPGWAKWNKDQQQYLDSSFTDLQQKFNAMKTDIAGLKQELANMKTEQAQLQSAMGQQQQALQEIKQLILSVQLAQTESSTNINSTLSETRSEYQHSIAAITATLTRIQAAEEKLLSVPGPQPSASSSSTTSSSQATPATSAATPVSGFITAVNGDEITISLGSSAGLHAGSRLDLFESKDPSVRVGVLEVTDVIDAGDAHVRVVSITPGVKPEFSDTVRPE